MSAQIHLFCHAGPSMGLSDEACLECAEKHRCAPNESDEQCEACGKLVRVIYALPGRLYELVCRACFLEKDGPQMVRDEAAKEFQLDLEVEA